MWLLQAKNQIWKNNKETKQNHKGTKIIQSITFQLKTSLNIFDWWVFLMRPHVCAQGPITWLSLLVYIDAEKCWSPRGAKPNLDEEAIMLRLHFQPLAVGSCLAVFVGFTKAAATIVRRGHTWRYTKMSDPRSNNRSFCVQWSDLTVNVRSAYKCSAWVKVPDYLPEEIKKKLQVLFLSSRWRTLITCCWL